MKHAEVHPSLNVTDCDPCKWASVSFGTVPGGAKDQKTGVSQLNQREKDLDRYREKRRAGEQPDGTTKQAMDSYDQRVGSWEKAEKTLEDSSPPDAFDKMRRTTLNTS